MIQFPKCTWSSLCGSGFSFRQNVRNSSLLQIISNWLILSSFHLASSLWQFYRILNTNSKRFQHVCVQTEVCNFCILHQTEWQKLSLVKLSAIGQSNRQPHPISFNYTAELRPPVRATLWLALVIWTLVTTHWFGRKFTHIYPPPKKSILFQIHCFLGGVQKVLCMRFWTSERCV